MVGPWPWISLLLESRTGVAGHWELLPQSPALIRHIQSCPQAFLGRPGRRKQEQAGTRQVPPSNPCLPTAVWPPGKELPSGMGCRQSDRSWNPEQRVEGLMAVTAIVPAQTKLWFSCLAVAFVFFQLLAFGECIRRTYSLLI